MLTLDHLALGKEKPYISEYTPSLLLPIERTRNNLAISGELPFKGADIWNAYEISWLNSKGKPQIALGEFHFPCTSPNLIESKSFKLYLHSFNQSRFASADEVAAIIARDLTNVAGAEVVVNLIYQPQFAQQQMQEFPGTCLDDLDIACETYEVNPAFLQSSENIINESVFSHLLKSHCLVTGQPDWASVLIQYRGPQIDHAGLLRYIISFRNHHEFHEQCAERIFMDIMQHCKPQELTVSARYTRRGGLDINPWRSTGSIQPANIRTPRQ